MGLGLGLKFNPTNQPSRAQNLQVENFKSRRSIMNSQKEEKCLTVDVE
jgi:hypothetical protein